MHTSGYMLLIEGAKFCLNVPALKAPQKLQLSDRRKRSIPGSSPQKRKWHEVLGNVKDPCLTDPNCSTTGRLWIGTMFTDTQHIFVQATVFLETYVESPPSAKSEARVGCGGTEGCQPQPR